MLLELHNAIIPCLSGIAVKNNELGPLVSLVVMKCIQSPENLSHHVKIVAVCCSVGKDDKGFAMYIDRQRSWFQHNSVHERRVEGGITTGSTIGVLLDLERHTLSFLVNEMPQGSVAFRDLYGVFYPAVSVNRGVTLTLHTAIDAPRMDYNWKPRTHTHTHSHTEQINCHI